MLAGPETEREVAGEVGRSGDEGGRETGVREGVAGGVDDLDIYERDDTATKYWRKRTMQRRTVKEWRVMRVHLGSECRHRDYT